MFSSLVLIDYGFVYWFGRDLGTMRVKYLPQLILQIACKLFRSKLNIKGLCLATKQYMHPLKSNVIDNKY